MSKTKELSNFKQNNALLKLSNFKQNNALLNFKQNKVLSYEK